MDISDSSNNPDRSMDTNVKKYPTIQRRLTVAFALLGTLVAATVILIQFFNFRTALRTELRQRLLSITRLAALQQDGDLFAKITSGQDEFYQKVNAANLKIKDSDPDLVFVYTMRKDHQGIYFVVDANRPGDEDISAFGEPYQEPGPTLAENFDGLDQTTIEPDFYTDEYGTFLSAYAPILSSSGENVGVLGIDISASKIVAKERGFLQNSILIFLALIPIIIILGIVFGRLFASPIVHLATATRKFGESNLEELELTNPGTREVAELASTFVSMTKKISELVNSLENKVSERTAQLEQANSRTEYRANLLQAVAQVARAIASIRDIGSLLPDITKVISDRFGFYHVGIFLLDENKEYAVLKAASSDGGKRMLARNHKLRVGQEGIVGSVTESGKPRVALDTGADVTYFRNPDLPETRSEITLPLIIGASIIGALDVQSKQPSAFSEDDIKVLGTLSDQVAVAIQNANLFSENRIALEEAQSAYQKFFEAGWSYFMGQAARIGYQYSNRQTQTLVAPLDRPEISAVLESGQTVTDSSPEVRLPVPTLAVPIKVRGEIIGVLDIRSINPNRTWDNVDITTAQTIADRLAFALENARLIDESQKRVARERAISDMTTKIGSSSDFDTILQQTVQELGRLIGNSEVVIRISKEHDGQPEG